MTLDELAVKHGADKSSIYHGYCAIYERYIASFRDQTFSMLEIGVQFGASIKMWLDYFPKAMVYGIDVANEHNISSPRFIFHQVDQGNSAELGAVFGNLALSFVVDDGCHRAEQMQASLNVLWPRLRTGGLYVLEDVFAVYHPFFRSNLDGSGFLHQFVDDVNRRGKLFHGMPDPPKDTPAFSTMERELAFVHYYNGLVVLGKK